MTPDLRALLDGLDAALAKATPGPWAQQNGAPNFVYGDPEVGIFVCDTGHDVLADGQPTADAALIVAAVNALPALLAAVRAAADLAGELDGHVMPRSFHPAGTHSDGASSAYADAAVRLRAALSAALPEASERDAE